METITQIATLYKIRHEDLFNLTREARIGGTVRVVLNFYRMIANIEEQYPDKVELRENELCSAYLGFASYYKRFLQRYYNITPEIILVGFKGDICEIPEVEEYVNKEAEKLKEICKYINGVYAIDLGDMHPRFALQTLMTSVKFGQDDCFILGLANIADMLSICKSMANIIGISMHGKHTHIMDRDSLANVMEVFSKPEEYLALVGCNELEGIKGLGPVKIRQIGETAFNRNEPLEVYLKEYFPEEKYDIFKKNLQALSFRNFYKPNPEYKVNICSQFVNLFDTESLERLNHEYFFLFPIDTRVLG